MQREELSGLVDEASSLARFQVSGVEEDLDASAFRERYEAAANQLYFDRHEPRPSDYLRARTLIQGKVGPLLNRLGDHVRDLTRPYAEPEGGNFRITVPLPTGPHLGVASHHRDFVNRAIRCAALHGTNETVEFLLSLLRSGSISYQRIVVLAGARPSLGQGGFEILPGVRLIDFGDESLLRGPAAFETIPETLMFSEAHEYPEGEIRFVRSAVAHNGALSFDLIHESAVARTDTGEYYQFDGSGHRLIYSYENRELSSTYLLDALSLVGGCPVTEVWAWHRFDTRFCALSGYCSRAYRYVQRHGSTARHLTADDVPRLRDVYGKLQAEEATELRTPIRRWAKTGLGYDFIEMATDLRITLESLFLNRDDRGALGYRIAQRGAWYLGNEDNRMDYFEVLQSAYRFCSSAIHTGAISDTKLDETLGAFETARKLCHQALLKRVEEGEKPDWNKLVLGMPQKPY